MMKERYRFNQTIILPQKYQQLLFPILGIERATIGDFVNE